MPGLSEDQIHSAFDTGAVEARIRQRDLNTDPPRWGVIGFDEAARAVELGAVALLNGDVLIIHANYLTAGFEQKMRKE